MTNLKSKWSDATIIARAGIESDLTHGSITPPLYLSSNFAFADFDQQREYDYTRSGNPTRDVLGETLAKLERGYHSVLTTTGMAALDVAFRTLKQGDLIIAPHDCYGGTHRLLSQYQSDGFYRIKFADLTDLSKLEETFSEKANLVLIEPNSNPLLRITDVATVAGRAEQDGALVVVDNTFLSPILQKPLELGAHAVVHSTTKYINGHSDVVGGAIIAKDKSLHEKFAAIANNAGVTGAPYDSAQTLRGLRTLILRVKAQSRSAQIVAEYLQQHPATGKVYYPGLRSHPGHELAARQQNGFGGMVSVELKGGISAVKAFLTALTNGPAKVFSLAESLGGFETLAAHPATMTHRSMSPEAREIAGIKDSLVRFSIGLEDVDDLIPALDEALNHAQLG